jgi:hypothetical protein
MAIEQPGGGKADKVDRPIFDHALKNRHRFSAISDENSGSSIIPAT